MNATADVLSSESTCHKCGGSLVKSLDGEEICFGCSTNWVQEYVAAGEGSNLFIDGHELVREIARGGMGVVYCAQQLEPHRFVALKMLKPMDSGVSEFRERFRVEASALADLEHPGILPLYQTGEHDGVPYFTMKLASGGSLQARLKGSPWKDVRESAELIAKMAEAVHYAHQRGVLHRDIKPANILFDERDNPYLADFGLAKIAGSDSRTALTGIMGTPSYMAPEVIEKGAASATSSSDIYGLGAVLYEMLTGTPPFKAESPAALARNIAECDPVPPFAKSKDVPRDLSVICLHCLEKSPERRYHSALELARDLRRWLNHEPITARRTSLTERLWLKARRNPGIAALVTAFALVLAGGVVALVIQNEMRRRALADAKASRELVMKQLDFFLGEHGDDLERIGKLKLLNNAWSSLYVALDEDRALTSTAAGSLKLARLLTRWSHCLDLMGKASVAREKAKLAIDAAKTARKQGADPLALAPVETEARRLVADTYADEGQFEDAFDELDASRDSLRALNEEDSLNLRAEVEMQRSEIYSRTEESNLRPAALDASEEAVIFYTSWAGEPPTDEKRALALSAALIEKSRVQVDLARHPHDAEEAEPSARKALESLDKVRKILIDLGAGKQNASSILRHELANELSWRGAALKVLEGDQPAEAPKCLKKRVALMQELHQQDPLNAVWLWELASAHYHLGDSSHEAQERVECFDKAISGMEKLLAQAPENRSYIFGSATVQVQMGLSLLELDPERAKELLKSALRIDTEWISRAAREGPDFKAYCQAVRSLTDTLRKHDPDLSLTIARDCLKLCEERLQKENSDPWWRWAAAKFHRDMAETHNVKGEIESALAANKAGLHERVTLLKNSWNLRQTQNDVPSSFGRHFLWLAERDAIMELLESGAEMVDLWRTYSSQLTNRGRWAVEMVDAAKLVLNKGKQYERQARSLAARSWIAFFHGAPPITSNEQKYSDELKEMAGDELPPRS